jgi:hypothetical protein
MSYAERRAWIQGPREQSAGEIIWNQEKLINEKYIIDLKIYNLHLILLDE